MQELGCPEANDSDNEVKKLGVDLGKAFKHVQLGWKAGWLAVLLLLSQSLHSTTDILCVCAFPCHTIQVQHLAPVRAVHIGLDAAADAILLQGTRMSVALHCSICLRQHHNLCSRIAPCIPYIIGTLLVFMW